MTRQASMDSSRRRLLAGMGALALGSGSLLHGRRSG
jgi:hypothetical protein